MADEDKQTDETTERDGKISSATRRQAAPRPAPTVPSTPTVARVSLTGSELDILMSSLVDRLLEGSDDDQAVRDLGRKVREAKRRLDTGT